MRNPSPTPETADTAGDLPVARPVRLYRVVSLDKDGKPTMASRCYHTMRAASQNARRRVGMLGTVRVVIQESHPVTWTATVTEVPR